jgi:two-component system chemotaxis response regulator CheY
MVNALVIDDNQQTAEALVLMLKLWDIPVKILLNPKSTMLLMEETKPQVVFLDINMPGINGLEILRFIKHESRFAGIPVIIVTSDDQPETAQKARECGAAAIVVKPVMTEMIEGALRNVGILD